MAPRGFGFSRYSRGQFAEQSEGLGAPEGFLNPFAFSQITQEPVQQGH